MVQTKQDFNQKSSELSRSDDSLPNSLVNPWLVPDNQWAHPTGLLMIATISRCLLSSS